MQSLYEAARLAEILREDPSSAIAAALAGWSHPVSREALIAMDHFDLDHTVAVGGKRVKPYVRPWESSAETARRGRVEGMTPEQTRAALRRAALGEYD